MQHPGPSYLRPPHSPHHGSQPSSHSADEFAGAALGPGLAASDCGAFESVAGPGSSAVGACEEAGLSASGAVELGDVSALGAVLGADST